MIVPTLRFLAIAPAGARLGLVRLLSVLLLSGPLMAAENPRVEFALGVLEAQRGKPEVAEARFENARSLDPSALPVVEKSVSFKLASGDRQGAVKLFRDLAAESPDRMDVQLAYVDLLEREGRGDALARKLAVETLEKILAKHPGEVQVISRLLNIFREAGDRERAVEWMEKLPEQDAAAAMIYQSLAQAMFRAEDGEARGKVDSRFMKALEADPKDQKLARAASDHFRRTGKPDQAILVLAAHVEAAPWSLDLRTRLGVLMFSAGRDAEGEAILQEVVRIHPGAGLALQSLAKFHRMNGNEEQARIYSADLLKIRGGSAREFVQLADEFLAADDFRSARLLLEKAVFDHPDHAALAMKLAVATRRDPETSGGAARLFREAEAVMDPDNMDADFLLESADVLAEDGDGKAAEERLRNAIRSFPPGREKETASAMRRLAGLWEKEGRNAEAARSLRQRADALDRE